jgi:hypothetical protein
LGTDPQGRIPGGLSAASVAMLTPRSEKKALVEDFEGRNAVVTWGASGIGFATARELALRGTTAIICDIDGEAARASASDLTGKADYELDLADRNGCLEVDRRVRVEHGLPHAC